MTSALDPPRRVTGGPFPRRANGESAGKIVAVLGPTNTGKTHLAIERMLGHRTGMIGFPLRLLARENYDRVRAIKGDEAVALVTGEERIVPPRATYFFCTVESMPLDREVGFLAIDEIQLCADRERGHIFTDRLLHARGRDETMFLGADTMKPVIARLVPEAEFVARPRFSKLTYAGPKKITRLPPRSATVAFSATEVYGIAELLRRQRGGAAVVLGALSPRTRNAQVAMFQAGEVDYLVATDAIGMGLNMDVNHVAFAGIRKFDGHAMRALAPNELAQIAGRAGRHMNDGTFGTTADVGALEPHVIEAIESHRFPTVKSVYWRSRALDFSSLAALKRSLDAPPVLNGEAVADLIRKGDAEDQLALAQLTADGEIRDLADRPSRLKLLWEVCQVPDFRHAAGEGHARLLGRIYHLLVGPDACLPADWVAGQIGRLDRTDGDIDTLVARIDQVRTWNYVAQRSDWTRDPAHWQGVARALEDKLSDALHERLTQRFVDRRAAVLARRLKDSGDLLSSVAEDGGVAVEGHYVGQLAGFRFRPDTAAQTADDRRAARSLAHAAGRALRGEIKRRIADMTDSAPGEIALDADGRLSWRGDVVAQLVAGRDLLTPEVKLLPSDLLDAEQQAALVKRLDEWMAARMQRDAGPLLGLRAASENPELPGALRGLLFQVMEGLGAMPRDVAAPQLAALDEDGRKKLAQAGVRVGALHVFMPALLGGRAVKRRWLLWRLQHTEAAAPPPLLLAGQASVELAEQMPAEQLRALGYIAFGPRALRLDQAEKFAFAVRRIARQGPFAANDELAQAGGVERSALEPMILALGLRSQRDALGVVFLSKQAPNRFKKAQGATEGAEDGAPRKRRRRKKKPGDQAAAAQVAAVEGASADGAAPPSADGEAPKRKRRRRKMPADTAAAGAPAAEKPKRVWIIPPMKEGAAAGSGAQDRSRNERPRTDRPDGDRPRRPRRDREADRAPRNYSDPKPRVDPDSPFAKLAEMIEAKKRATEESS